MKDIHDEIGFEVPGLGDTEPGEWNTIENAEETSYLMVFDPVNQAAVACEIIGDVERLLYTLVGMPEGFEWLRSEGWDWVDRHSKMNPEPEGWLHTRSLGGTTLRFVAEEVLKKPEWIRHVDEVKECAMQLLLYKPEKIAVACVWVSMFYPGHSSWCDLLLGRLCRLDKRLDPDADWVLESALIFGELSAQMENEAQIKADEAQIKAEKAGKEALEAKAELERVAKPKFI